MALAEGNEVMTIAFATGVVAVNTDFDVPAETPYIIRILGGQINELVEAAPPTYTRTDLTVTAPDTLSAGEIARVDHNTLKCGTALTGSSLLVLQVEVAIQRPQNA